jgi:hypothetical protein
MTSVPGRIWSPSLWVNSTHPRWSGPAPGSSTPVVTATAPVQKDKDVRLSVKTDYPQDGVIAIRIDECKASEPWRLRLRVPAWGRVASLAVNGKAESAKPVDGWLDLKRAWRAGDEVRLEIPMTVWFARPNSEEPLPPPETGKVLRSVRIFRGPLLMSVAKTCNEHLAAKLFEREKAVQMFKINWDEFQPPLKLTLGAGEKPSVEYTPLKIDASKQFPFLTAASARLAATAVAGGPDKDKQGKPAPVLLVPIADDKAKRGPKIIVFDVAWERKQK